VPTAVVAARALRLHDGTIDDFEVTYANPAAVRLAGRAREALIGTRVGRWLPSPALLDEHREVVETRMPFTGRAVIEGNIEAHAGLHGVFALAVVPFGDGFVSTVADVTADARDESRLRESETQLAEAQRVAHFGSWEYDLRTGTVSWTDELYRIYGVARSEYRPSLEAYLGRVHPDDRRHVADAIRRAADTGAPFRFDERVVRPDGSVRILHSGGGVVCDDHGRPVKMIGACHDVTEREQASRRLAEAQAELDRRRAAERQAKALNDGVIGSLVEAVQALDAGDERGAQRAMRTTLEHASRIVCDLVGPAAE
jgi:PAS domain S-box-containing protein